VISVCLRLFLAGFLPPVRRWGVPPSDSGFEGDVWVAGGLFWVEGGGAWFGDWVVPGTWTPFVLGGQGTVTGTTWPVMSLT
jgi:hypothetical protein